MQTTEYKFDYNNLKEVPFDKYDKDFTFIVDGQKFATSRFVADLISPAVRRMHYTDQTAHEFIINTGTKQKRGNNDFLQFLEIVKGHKIELDNDKRMIFSRFFLLVGDTATFGRLENIKESEMTESIALIKLESDCENKMAEVEFVSKHMDQILVNQKEKLMRLDVNVLDMILSNQNIKLKDEDSLLDFTIDLYEEDHSYGCLFEYVDFLNVSSELLRRFINVFEFEDLNMKTWKSLCHRFLVDNEKKNDENNEIEVSIYHDDKEMNGLMRHLTDKSGGNIHDNGTIEITTNSLLYNDSNHHPKCLVDYQRENYYASKNDGSDDAFICFDFKNKLVNLTSYSIKSNSNKDGWNTLKNWAIEVSNNGKEWIEIDRRIDESALRGARVIHTFDVAKKSIIYYRFVRLRQTGKTGGSGPNNYFWFYNIEFYGSMKYT